ncbi:MAG: glycosyltransferase family 4 protein [Chloroherpetonaceae bacterium]|nr:glycosyltransferase family 4 protein [Chloroherpetonaceae bacterium]MCS7210391.1 glycosyltransferase family 4 protein [Chloroherpetonaceae bacterium]MDW8019861.1 glycosyltransferase family 4 protein [Chloroherpetonaceae bacterium]MDW8465071.1 glycosyltransferase family 4 protein [Chloroherpetonaceae bacterium]
MVRSRKKVLLVANTSWYLCNFRIGVIRYFQAQQFEVVAVSPKDNFSHQLQGYGCRWVDLPLLPHSTNPLSDLYLLWRLYALYAAEQPALVIHYTIKPNVYGSLAAGLLRLPSVAVFSGAGRAFAKQDWLNRIVKRLLKIALRFATEVWFVNPDDRALFLAEQLVLPEKTYLVPGEGIDTAHFSPQSALAHLPPSSSDKVIFLMSARLLREKGVELYAQAARCLKPKYPNAEFQLLGFLSEGNPAFVSKAEVESWKEYVQYLGDTQNVLPYLSAADCVVLPSSYREGTPRTLLEAASLEKPIVTTNQVGCRHVVEDGVTGFLVQPNNLKDLVEKLERILTMSPEARAEMGRRGRLKMLKEFDESLVIECYHALLQRLHLA